MPRLKRTWFNPLYFHLRKYVDIPTIRKIKVYGSKSSAKTFSIAQLFSNLSYLQDFSTICYRKESTTIKTTLKPAFKKAIDSIHYDAVYTERDFKFDCANEREHIFKGLDTEGKVKGIEGFKYLLFDELDHFTEEEWRQANASLRGVPNQKLFATWNPVDENIWIKTELDTYEWVDLPLMVDDNPYSQLDKNSFVRISKDGKILLIKTTYFDNKWMVGGDGYGFRDQNLIDEYEASKALNENWYNVNVLGEWGVVNKAGKFCWAFNNSQIVPTIHDPERITWATFDFNLNPMTATIFQLLPEERTIRGIECIKLENSDIWKMCDRLNASYPEVAWMVTGDATGKNGSAMVEDSMNFYKIIMQKLQIMDQQIKIPSKNPPITENQLLVNAVLKNWKVELDPERCKPLIFDCTYVEMNGKGEIIKDRTSASKYADFLDGFRYFINMAVRPHFDIFTE